MSFQILLAVLLATSAGLTIVAADVPVIRIITVKLLLQHLLLLSLCHREQQAIAARLTSTGSRCDALAAE